MMEFKKSKLKIAMILASSTLFYGMNSVASVPADSVYHNGYIYTSDSDRSIVQALAVKDGNIVYVGDNDGVESYISEGTDVVDLDNKMMMPGLHDVHIHPMAIVDFDVCDIPRESFDLDQLVAFIESCRISQNFESAEKIVVTSWRAYAGNDPTENYASIIEALDAISMTKPVYLVGYDGHTAAANSFAFNNAVNDDGAVVAVNRETLSTIYSDYADFFSVDSEGNPTGTITEGGMALLNAVTPFDLLIQRPELVHKISEKLNKYGITSAKDALTDDAQLALYKKLYNDGDMTFRLTTTQVFDVEPHIIDGDVQMKGLIRDAKAIRSSLEDYPLIKADSVKIFVDGILEGNPLTEPPTLPTAMMLNEFKQPIVDYSLASEDGILPLTYVDTASAECVSARNHPGTVDDDSERQTFFNINRYYPEQCTQATAEVMRTDENFLPLQAAGLSTKRFLKRFVRSLDKANFAVHMHAIGDGAANAAIDAIEYAKKKRPESTVPHAIAHLQMVSPEDQQRIGELGIYTVFTYGWMVPFYLYDLTVVPFVDEIEDTSVASLYNEDNYYMKTVYPVRSVLDAGAVLVAGSDAPVETREPIPFYHMTVGMTRNDYVEDEVVALNANQTVSIHDMIKAYTINGAKALSQEEIVGSLEVGKRADMVILDQNIVELAENTENPLAVYEIKNTQVLSTIFDGDVVYTHSPVAQ